VVAVVQTATARLVVLPPHRGERAEVPLDRNLLVLGRDPAADLVLDDTAVSWRHAEIARVGGRWLVRDLGSTNGTSVGGRPVTAPVEIRAGDVLVIGGVRLRMEERSPSSAGPPTSVIPALPVPGSGFSAGDQWAQGSITNVEGVQNNYVQHVMQQRESFLREVAATRTKARWFVWSGLALLVAGMAAGVYAVLTSFQQITSVLGTDVEPSSSFNPFGGDFVPLFAFAEFGTLIGALLVVVGIVLHVVATARKRRVDERLPLPFPRPPSP
jgi:pSer/pThr/pTyr-binding forkhead associated (FHA) protein